MLNRVSEITREPNNHDFPIKDTLQGVTGTRGRVVMHVITGVEICQLYNLNLAQLSQQEEPQE